MRNVYQPKITPHNSFRYLDVPMGILTIARYHSLSYLSEIDESRFEIFYVLEDESVFPGKLIPIRNATREFLTVVTVKEKL